MNCRPMSVATCCSTGSSRCWNSCCSACCSSCTSACASCVKRCTSSVSLLDVLLQFARDGGAHHRAFLLELLLHGRELLVLARSARRPSSAAAPGCGSSPRGRRPIRWRCAAAPRTPPSRPAGTASARAAGPGPAAGAGAGGAGAGGRAWGPRGAGRGLGKRGGGRQHHAERHNDNKGFHYQVLSRVRSLILPKPCSAGGKLQCPWPHPALAGLSLRWLTVMV